MKPATASRQIFANQMRKYRKTKKWRLVDIANATNLTPNSLVHILNSIRYILRQQGYSILEEIHSIHPYLIDLH